VQLEFDWIGVGILFALFLLGVGPEHVNDFWADVRKACFDLRGVFARSSE